jgi:peptidoglycan LD-endopeptidase CwlK
MFIQVFLIFSQAIASDGGLTALVRAYPGHFRSGINNCLIWNDGEIMQYDTGRQHKNFEEMLNAPDLRDQMSMRYPAGEGVSNSPPENFDPGRVRYEPFFLKMYGKTKQEVTRRLVSIPWMPKTTSHRLLITMVNNAHLKVEKISEDLDGLPDHLKKYVTDIAGTFSWRNVAGTNRLSTHAFGIAVDISAKYADYWPWQRPWRDGKCLYRNRIPPEIINVFERNGFIWGGRWYHYDTMHFEYRPELFFGS